MVQGCKPPQVVGLFLVKFDMRTGYEMVWSKLKNGYEVDLSGIEYKVLPSGIHEFREDMILFTHMHDKKIYYGVSKFRQITIELENPFDDSNAVEEHVQQIDRSNIYMYSLGCLCAPLAETDWIPDTYISNGFEYIAGLDEYLVEFLNNPDMNNYDKLQQIDVDDLPINKFHNPIVNLLKFFNYFGPLVFTLYKLCLTRPRIIIFNQGKDNNFLVETFNYILSILSLIPQKLKINHQNTRSHLGKDLDFIQPLYNISLNDLESPLLKLSSFIATTNDDILMYQPIYDYAIILNHSNPCPIIRSFKDINAHNHPLKSTYNDYTKFKIVYQQLIDKSDNVPHNKSVDNLSINTSNSFLSNFKFFGSNLGASTAVIKYEPNWWLKDSTYPISWTQYIWSAFSWFASAGQYSDLDQQSSPSGPTNGPHYNNSNGGNSKSGSSSNLLAVPRPQSRNSGQLQESNSEDYFQYVEIIGYFHKLTKKWVYLVNEILLEQNSNKIELTYQDLIDLELDPYNKDDHAFLTQFIHTFWDIESVQISSGLNFFC